MASHLRTTGCHQIRCRTILRAARRKRAHPGDPALTPLPAGEGWYSIYLPRMDGRLS